MLNMPCSSNISLGIAIKNPAFLADSANGDVVPPDRAALLEDIVFAHNGRLSKKRGPLWAATFSKMADALATARAMQHWHEASRPSFRGGPLHVALALHLSKIATGASQDNLVLDRVMRLAAAAHSGQIVLSAAAATAAQSCSPAHLSLRPLGALRLSDLLHPDPVFQLCVPDRPNDFPPLQTIDQWPHNLPMQLYPLIGRAAEETTLTGLLCQPSTRLLTLTGAAGIGKTRLIIQVGANLLPEFSDGVYLIPLAPIQDPDLVVSAIARQLSLKEQPGISLLESLQAALHTRRILLILDSFEHLLTATPAIRALLQAAPQMKLVVTSREPLGLAEEHEFPIAPLSLPDGRHTPDALALSRSAAGALFVARAQEVQPTLTVTEETAAIVAQICTRLDGLPLAIELAAAQSKVLTLREILRRLEGARDVTILPLLAHGAPHLIGRHQTLRGAIGWSYTLLEPDLQFLFTHLALFVGGCTAEAVAAILAVDDPAPVQARLVVLQKKSLLQSETAKDGTLWFRMLAAVREYALEHLEQNAHTAGLHRRHALYYLGLAAAPGADLRGRAQEEWLQGLSTVYDNLRAALGWAQAHDTEIFLRLVGALWPFWRLQGHLSEGRRWLAAALDRCAGASSLLQAPVFQGAGCLAFIQGDYEQSWMLHETSLQLWQQTEDAHGMAAAFNSLGGVAQTQGRYEQAANFYQQSLALRRTLNDQLNIAASLNNLGILAQIQGNYSDASTLHQENIALRRRMGDRRGTAVSLTNLGVVLLYQAAYEQASLVLEEAGDIFSDLGDRRGQAAVLANLGRVCLYNEDPDKARGWYIKSLELFRDLGDKSGIAECLEGLAGAAGRHKPNSTIYNYVARLLGAAAALHEAMKAPLAPGDRAIYNQLIARMNPFNDPRWHGAWAEGERLSIDKAVAYALQGMSTTTPTA